MTDVRNVRRLPDAVVAECLAFLDLADHCRCAQVCRWFRGLALLPAGFPDTVRVVTSRHLGAASPALAQMRPRRRLEICVAELPDLGAVALLLRGQTRVRQLVLSRTASARDRLVDMTCTYNIPPSPLPPQVVGDDPDRQRLEACERLDMSVRAEFWRPWFPTLLARLPLLTRLEMREFPEDLAHLLCDGVPQLTALRITNNSQDPDGTHEVSGGTGFAHRLLTGLAHLRSLALPYASVPYRDLLVAARGAASPVGLLRSPADRLESLEVRDLCPIFVAARHTEPQVAATTATADRGKVAAAVSHMARLTHLVASMCDTSAEEILARTPHVRRGRLAFQAVYAHNATAMLTAHLDLVGHCATNVGDDGSGGGEEKGRAETANASGDAAEQDGGGGGGRNGGGRVRAVETRDVNGRHSTHIVWYHSSDGLAPDDATFTATVCRAISKLRTDWCGHDFGAGVSDETIRQISTALPRPWTRATTAHGADADADSRKISVAEVPPQ